MEVNYHESLCFIFLLEIYRFCLETELITPPLDGTILEGVTRQSILELTRKWVNLVFQNEI